MRKHHSLGVSCCSTCEHDVTANTRALLGDSLQDHSVLDLVPELQRLTPSEDLDSLVSVSVFGCLGRKTLPKQNGACDAGLFQPVRVVQILFFQALVCVADKDFCFRELGLVH
jgi:hypothetical protein